MRSSSAMSAFLIAMDGPPLAWAGSQSGADEASALRSRTSVQCRPTRSHRGQAWQLSEVRYAPDTCAPRYDMDMSDSRRRPQRRPGPMSDRPASPHPGHDVRELALQGRARLADARPLPRWLGDGKGVRGAASRQPQSPARRPVLHGVRQLASPRRRLPQAGAFRIIYDDFTKPLPRDQMQAVRRRSSSTGAPCR